MKTQWYILFVIWIASLCSCTREIIYDRSNLPNGMLIVEAYPYGFNQKESRTGKNKFEFKVSNKCLLVFDSQGNLATKPQYAEGQDAAFMINRNEDFKHITDTTVLANCKIYVVANLPLSTFAHVTDTTSLNNIQVYAEKSSVHLEKLVNFDGLPMIGYLDSINLQKGATDLKIAAPIKLNTIYAKVVVDIQMQIKQAITGHIPFFIMDSWRVKNLPEWATLGAPDLTAETTCTKYYAHGPEGTIASGNKEISDGRGHIKIEFYALESKVNPNKSVSYPSGIKENEKQRFKPLLCDTTAEKKPMIVEIKGMYWDHQKHTHNVTYNIYLGENNFDNFYVNRNCQLTNNVTIQGLSKDANSNQESISFDCRVNTDYENKDFNIKIERETMLDSHIEIRPIDVELKDKPDTVQKVIVELVNPENMKVITDSSNPEYNWARFEKKNSAPKGDKTWCENGKRKYFTKTLMTDLKDYTETISEADIKNNNARIWVYFDENLYASTDKMRSIIVRFRYFEDEAPKDTIDYKFMQHDLYPVDCIDSVTNETKTYYIEYYEEYLYNFDPKDPFSNRTDGMAWGPEGLMSENPAIAVVGENKDWIDKIINAFSKSIKELAGNYDYYEVRTSKDKNGNPIGPAGIDYTRKLLKAGRSIEVKNENYMVLPLDALPRSAAEYCANKNKRNSNGEVDTLNLGWYLPAIGELQDITKTAYAKFKAFQNQLYWSSQPSYTAGKWIFNGYNYKEGPFYIEVVDSARVTKTEIKPDGTFGFLGSDVTKGCVKAIKKDGLFGKAYVDTTRNSPIEREPGNFRRDEIYRVRAVRADPGGGLIKRR